MASKNKGKRPHKTKRRETEQSSKNIPKVLLKRFPWVFPTGRLTYFPRLLDEGLRKTAVWGLVQAIPCWEALQKHPSFSEP